LPHSGSKKRNDSNTGMTGAQFCWCERSTDEWHVRIAGSDQYVSWPRLCLTTSHHCRPLSTVCSALQLFFSSNAGV